MIYDRVSWLQWSRTEGAASGKNKPEPLAPRLMGINDDEDSDLITFDSPEDYELQRKQILEGR